MVRLVLTVVALFSSIQLTEWALIFGIISTFLTGCYAALQIYILWRDKIARRKGKPFPETTL
jgi:uncharacterized membrane-anchored protein